MGITSRQIYIYTPKCLQDTAKGKLSSPAHGRFIGGAYIFTDKKKRMIQLRTIRNMGPGYVIQKLRHRDQPITLLARI